MVPLSGKVIAYPTWLPMPGVRVQLSTKTQVLGETTTDENGEWLFYAPINSCIGVVYTSTGYQPASNAVTTYSTGSYSAGTITMSPEVSTGTPGTDTLEFMFLENHLDDESGDTPPLSGALVSLRFGGKVLRLDGSGNAVWVATLTGIGLVYDDFHHMSTVTTDATGKARFTGIEKRAEGSCDVSLVANQFRPYGSQGMKTYKMKYNTTPTLGTLILPLPEFVSTTYYGVYLYVTVGGANCPGQTFWLTKTGYTKRETADDGTDTAQPNVSFGDISVSGEYRLSFEVGGSSYMPKTVTDRITGEVIANIDTLDGFLYAIQVSGAERHIDVEMVAFHTLAVPFQQDIEADDASDDTVASGSIAAGVAYIVDGYTSIIYDGDTFLDQEKFVGKTAKPTYTPTGTGKVRVWTPAPFERPVSFDVLDDAGTAIPATAAFGEDTDPPAGLIATVRLPDGGYTFRAATSKFTGIKDVRS